MTRKIALFDMDDTLVDYTGQLRRDLAFFNGGSEPEVIYGAHSPDWVTGRVSMIRSRPNWWVELPKIDSGIGLMELCRDIGFDIHILSQGPNDSKAWGQKKDWCDEHVAPIDPDYILTITRGGKHNYYGRVFVDDYPDYMAGWLVNRPRGLGLMPSIESNACFSHKQVLKYDSVDWRTSELEDLLQEAFDR